jgi:hypothetical protein
MTTIKNIGISFMIIGVLITLYTMFIFISEEKLIDLGPVEVIKEKSTQLPWPTLIGILIMLVGSGFLVFGTRKVN